MTDKINSNDFASFAAQNDDLDLGQLFRFLLMQSKLILSIVLVVFVIAFTIYTLSTKQYNIKSLVQYEAYNQNVFDPSQPFNSMAQGQSSDISNMLELYESRTNYLKVINDLKLNIKAEGLSKKETIDISINSVNSDPDDKQKLVFSFSENGYSLLDENLDIVETSQYGEQILFNDLTISVKSANLQEYRQIKIIYRNPEGMFNSFKSAMDISTNSSRNSSLLFGAATPK